MNDDEFLISCLKKYLASVKDEYDYAKQFTDTDSMEIAEDNIEIYDILKVLIDDISGIESLNDLDDDDYGFIFECLQSYAEAFIIDGRDEESKKASEEEYKRLNGILEEMSADFYYDEDEDE
ncbi:MAG: hypothetical protein K6F15_03575 [Treponema sp.]|nr:hypothetical protein [Treponema sp.]